MTEDSCADLGPKLHLLGTHVSSLAVFDSQTMQGTWPRFWAHMLRSLSMTSQCEAGDIQSAAQQFLTASAASSSQKPDQTVPTQLGTPKPPEPDETASKPDETVPNAPKPDETASTQQTPKLRAICSIQHELTGEDASKGQGAVINHFMMMLQAWLYEKAMSISSLQ